MKKGDYVRVIPIRGRTNLVVDFVDGKPQPRSPRPLLFGHWYEGYLAEDLIQSARIWLDGRHVKDGHVIDDTWRSMRIYSVVGDTVFCERGKYRVLKVPPYEFPPYFAQLDL